MDNGMLGRLLLVYMLIVTGLASPFFGGILLHYGYDSMVYLILWYLIPILWWSIFVFFIGIPNGVDDINEYVKNGGVMSNG